MRACLASVLAVVLVAGCGKVKEEKWLEKSAEASCKTAERCDTASFYFAYTDVDACVADTIAGSSDLYTGCAYDPKAAKQCLKSMDWSCKKIGQNYEELVEACESVWSCTVEETGATTETGFVPSF